MTQVKPSFRNQISLGNLLQIGVFLVSITAAWFVMDSRSKINSTIIAEVRAKLQSTEERLHAVETEQARGAAQFRHILDILDRIDRRLERIEERK